MCKTRNTVNAFQTYQKYHKLLTISYFYDVHIIMKMLISPDAFLLSGTTDKPVVRALGKMGDGSIIYTTQKNVELS